MENFEFKSVGIERKKTSNYVDVISNLESLLRPLLGKADPNLELLHIIETKNDEMGDISFNISGYSKKIEISDSIVAINNGLVEFVDQIEVVNGFVNIYLNKKRLACEIANNFNIEDNLIIKSGQKFDVEFGHLNLEKPQNIGHLRNLFSGIGESRVLKLAGAVVSTSVVVNDIGMKASRLYNAVYKNIDYYERIESLNDKDFFVALKNLYNEVNLSEESEFEAKKINEEIHFGLDEGSDLSVLKRKVARRSVGATVRLWKNLGIKCDNILFQSEAQDDKSIKYNLLDDGRKKNIFVEREDLLYANLAEINLGQHVLIKNDGTETYIIKDLITIIKRIQALDIDKLYICVGPSLFHHYEAVHFILEKVYPDLSGKLCIIKHQLCHIKKDTSTDLFSFIENTKEELDNLKVDENISLNEIFKINLFYQSIINDLSSHVNLDISSFLQTSGDTGMYLLYTVKRFENIVKKIAPHEILEHKIKEQDLGHISKSEKKIMIKFLFLKNNLKKAVESSNPTIFYREFINISRLLNTYYVESPKFVNLDLSKPENTARLKIFLKIVDVYKFLFNRLFNT